MFRSPSSARQASRRGLASAVAFAVALSGGSLVGTAVLSSPAYAQKKPSYSREFVKAYQPVEAILKAEGGDMNAAKAQLDAVYAAIKNDDDRNAAGNVTLMIGNKLNDPVLQRHGLELMLQSGKVAPEQVGQFNFFVGNLAFAAGDYEAARTALKAAVASGYTQDNPQGLIIESYLSEKNVAGALDYLSEAAAAAKAAGQELPENYYLRGLQAAYDANDLAASTKVSAMLVKAYPTTENWKKSLQVFYSLGSFDPPLLIDVLRLMRDAGALSERREFVSYIEAADPRIMSNEVQGVLADAVAAGELTTSESYYADVKRVVDERAPADRRDITGLAKEASTSSTGKAAYNAGEVYLSLGDNADAEAMYEMALAKGVEDPNRTLTRLGIVETRQGKYAEATETFGKITGDRAPIAAMWLAYIATKS
jgi:tetratricopeptide (TPR) repeat protein